MIITYSRRSSLIQPDFIAYNSLCFGICYKTRCETFSGIPVINTLITIPSYPHYQFCSLFCFYILVSLWCQSLCLARQCRIEKYRVGPNCSAPSPEELIPVLNYRASWHTSLVYPSSTFIITQLWCDVGKIKIIHLIHMSMIFSWSKDASKW